MEQEQEQEQDITTTPTEQQEEEAEVQPTKSVKTFWERLDEVFTQNTEFKERMEELMENFPDTQRVSTETYRSFLFQPERIAISSNDDAQPSNYLSSTFDIDLSAFATETTGHAPGEQYSKFRVNLKRPIRNIKSIQLLSATIPNAIQNIPDGNVFFFYYKLRSVQNSLRGAWVSGTNYGFGDIVTYLGNTYVFKYPTDEAIPNTVPPNIDANFVLTTLPANLNRPNYYDLNPSRIQAIYLTPTYQFVYEYTADGDERFFNKTFEDYADVVSSLNFIASNPDGINSLGFTGAIPNDISFVYNPTLNKIIMVPSPTQIAANYYYLPCGYEDKNIPFVLENGYAKTIGNEIVSIKDQFVIQPGQTLNYKLGFTWNGTFPDPFLMTSPWTNNLMVTSVYWYMRGRDPGYTGAPYPWQQNIITFNSYPDLVNTSCVRFYADFAFGTTQDSSTTATQPDGLLSIVPVNTTNLGVGFYQNNFNNPLTKIPQNLTEIGISMLTDQGLPYYLPNSATVLLELAFTYH